MSIHEHMSQSPSPFVQLHPDLLATIAEIAAQNGRTIGDVANELIYNALFDHDLTERSLRIWHLLTQREREITALIWLGLTNPQIAQNLLIAENTVKTHVKHILSKFNVRSKKKLAEHLAGLDLSDWIDSMDRTYNTPPPTSADSPNDNP